MTDRPPPRPVRSTNGRPPATTHQCPGGCGAQVPRHLLSCKPDWFRLPAEIRRLFDHGQGRSSDAQMDALSAAFEFYADNPRQESGS